MNINKLKPVVLIVLLAGLAACSGSPGGGSTPSKPPITKPEEPKPEPVVGCMDKGSHQYNPKANRRGSCAADSTSALKKTGAFTPDQAAALQGAGAGGDWQGREPAYLGMIPGGDHAVAPGFKQAGDSLKQGVVVDGIETNLRREDAFVAEGGTAQFTATHDDAYRLKGTGGVAKGAVDFRAATAGGAPLANNGSLELSDVCPLYKGKGGRALAGCGVGEDADGKPVIMTFGTSGDERRPLTK